MVKTKEKDFVEIDYTGRIKESNQIFDLTDKELAKKENIFKSNAKYGSKIICLGEKQILPSLDKSLIDKEINKVYKIELKPEEAFGKKEEKLIKIVSADILKEQNIRPFPGLQINASGLFGTIRSVAGGRLTIDFNHPLAGKNLVYEIKINRIVEQDEEKLKALIENLLGIQNKEYELKIENKKATLNLKSALPVQIKAEFKKRVKDLIPNLELSLN